MPVSEHFSAAVGAAATQNHHPSTESYREVRAQQIALLFRQLPAMLVATPLIALIVVGVMWHVADRVLLVAWGITVFAVSAYRFLLWRRFTANPPQAPQIDPWLRNFCIGTLLAGVVWGAAGLLFVGHGLLYEFFFGLLLVVLTAGGVATLSSYRGAYCAFLIPATLPFALRVALVPDLAHIAVAAMVLVYIALMLGISARIHAAIAESLRMRFHDLGLVGRLSAIKEHLEEANSALQFEVFERRKAQEILMKSEQKLRLHTQQVPLAYIEWDPSFRVVDWNPAAERMFGYSRSEVLGRHAASLIAAERTCETISTLWRQLLGDKTGARVTVENRTKGGRGIVCEWYYTPLVDSRGKVAAVITLAQDVTAGRQAGGVA